jgi:hypothetical protein
LSLKKLLQHTWLQCQVGMTGRSAVQVFME